MLTNNSAHAYGGDIATSPYELLRMRDHNLSLIPGIDSVNVGLLMKDGFGQMIKGTTDYPIPYILEWWTCPLASCGVQSSLSPLSFLSFDTYSGVANTSRSKQSVVCTEQYSAVTIYFSVYGSASNLLTETVEVHCLECSQPQARENEVATNGFPVWFCMPCLAGQYIINPNQDSCQDCPAGKPSKRHPLFFTFLTRISIRSIV